MTSTLKIGDEFRDLVAGILRISGRFTNVKVETLEGHKRVDVTFEERAFGKIRRYALEAKRWSKALSKEELATILGHHLALIQKGLIDEVLVVSEKPLRGASASKFIETTREISHQTFAEFQESVMGFTSYLNKVVSSHEHDGLEDYYVPARLTDGKIAEQAIARWLRGTDTAPIAIMASYGMGKTSFAQHMAYVLAKGELGGDHFRIPILLSLGSISRATNLEGLLGKTLASDSHFVRGYNYDLFMELNRIGRFLIILDGFDEMKHMMSESEFHYNFDQLHRLAIEDARVLLLGRPSAFLSGEERGKVLRGMRKFGGEIIKIPDRPVYNEWTLEMFTAAEATTFVENYLRRSLKNDEPAATKLLLRRRTELANSAATRELIRRPVHAWMLAQLATNSHVDLDNISRFDLYKYFIDRLLEREMEKPERRGITREQRRAFMRSLAWWLWTKGSDVSLGCRIENIPDSMFIERFHIGENDDPAAIKRELISGSFLEEKGDGIFYVPHRSFLEFLVAEYIEHSNDLGGLVMGYQRYFTPEVIQYIAEGQQANAVNKVLTALRKLRGKVSLEFLRNFRQSTNALDQIMRVSAHERSPWDVFMLYFGSPGYQTMDTNSQCIANLAVIAEGAPVFEPWTAMAVLTCFTLSLSAAESHIDQVQFGNAIVRLLAGRLSDTHLRNEKIIGGSGPEFLLLKKAVKAESKDGKRRLWLDPHIVFVEAIKALKPMYVLQELESDDLPWTMEYGANIELDPADMAEGLDPSRANKIQAYLFEHHNG